MILDKMIREGPIETWHISIDSNDQHNSSAKSWKNMPGKGPDMGKDLWRLEIEKRLFNFTKKKTRPVYDL